MYVFQDLNTTIKGAIIQLLGGGGGGFSGFELNILSISLPICTALFF